MSRTATTSAKNFGEDFLQRLRFADHDAYKIIERLVPEQREEDLWLDFVRKTDASLASLSDDDRRNFAKALSGFAHSDGGVIVWGVAASKAGNDPESPDVANGLEPIQNLAAFHTNLNDLLSRATKPIVPNVVNLRVPRPDGSGYVVTYVPQSEHPPHRADCCGNNFYKRSGSAFYKLEPFDLRDLILRDNHPKLQINHRLQQVSRTANTTWFELILEVTNRGPGAVTDWKLVLEFSNAIAYTQNPPALPYMGNVTGTGEEFRGPDTGVWRRISLLTTLLGNRGECILLPEDTLVLVGHNSVSRYKAFFLLNDEVQDQGGRPIIWKFFASNAPSLRGEIWVK